MAKRDKKKGKKDNKPAEAVGAVRTAVERTFQATADSAQSTRTRAQDLVDELAGAAGRVRELIDVRVLEDIKRLRTEVETLTRRVAALEDKPAKPATRSRSSASGGGTRARSAAAGKPASSTSRAAGTARSTAAKRSSAAKPRSTAAKSTAAKPRSAAAKKPAS